MKRLRARNLIQVVLGWFVLVVAMSVVAPAMAAGAPIDSVCTAAGPVAIGHGAGQPGDSLAMKCPLCMPAHAPGPQPVVDLVQAHPLAHLLQPVDAARVAAITAAPLPARGPPANVLA